MSPRMPGGQSGYDGSTLTWSRFIMGMLIFCMAIFARASFSLAFSLSCLVSAARLRLRLRALGLRRRGCASERPRRPPEGSRESLRRARFRPLSPPRRPLLSRRRPLLSPRRPRLSPRRPRLSMRVPRLSLRVPLLSLRRPRFTRLRPRRPLLRPRRPLLCPRRPLLSPRCCPLAARCSWRRPETGEREQGFQKRIWQKNGVRSGRTTFALSPPTPRGGDRWTDERWKPLQ